MGYYRAGFDVVGVDIEPQPRYPFEFHQADAIEFVTKYGNDFDVIAASPPCQDYTPLRHVTGKRYPRLIEATREAIKATGKPYIIENVPGARFELVNPIMLCGSMFGLRVIRHRYFECSFGLVFPPFSCCHNGKASGNKNYKGKSRSLDDYQFLTITGHDFRVADARIAMDTDWMTQKGLSQAIPPAYTEWLGKRLLERMSEYTEPAS